MSDNLKAALIMSASMALFTINDAFMKSLADVLPLHQILMLRNGVVTAILVAMAWRGGALRRPMSRRDLALTVLRGLLEAATASFFLTALFHLPLANATAIVQSSPLAVMLVAALVLGEKIGWRRGLAAALGFFGVLLIVQPGVQGFNRYAVFALLSVLTIVARDIVTRKLSSAAPTLVVAVVTSGIVGVVSTAVTLGAGWVPVSAGSGGLIAGAIVAVLGAYLASVQAMRIGDVSFVSPFRYSALIWALVLGLVVFGDWPAPSILIGAVIVVGSGVYSFWREAIRTRRSAAEAARVARQRAARPGA
ncbi:DMT family transporter [Pseudooceanicola sp. C21-150M6]|uniref:DMT family transporter n=1 Tax=Pseudooceanicola sp. C21-150M6 TaxID=3434355 RepID=UPI003D7FC824